MTDNAAPTPETDAKWARGDFTRKGAAVAWARELERECAAWTARVKELEAALAQAREDAERYRWERDNPAWETEAFLSGMTPEQYDAAIDAARREKP